ENPGDEFRFDLPHADGHAVPAVFGLMENPDNSSRMEDAPSSGAVEELQGILAYKDGKLSLTLRNKAGLTLKNVRVLFRLPLEFKDGVVKQALADMGPGEEKTIEIQPALASEDFLYTSDRLYLAAQVDFDSPVIPKRLYCTVFAPGYAADPSYPR